METEKNIIISYEGNFRSKFHHLVKFEKNNFNKH